MIMNLVELDLDNYATKEKLKNITHVENFNSLKTKVDKNERIMTI